tara:strand:- start:1425 stop:1670 length:246 start_codon:yes stop_codon:yes gene_type:complete
LEERGIKMNTSNKFENKEYLKKFDNMDWDSYDDFERVIFDKNVNINFEFLLNRVTKNRGIYKHLEKVLIKLKQDLVERGII